MPPNWPELTLALALAVVVAYLVADFVARLVQSTLRAIIADTQYEAMFVERPRRIIRLTHLPRRPSRRSPSPRLTLAGYETTFSGDPRGGPRAGCSTTGCGSSSSRSAPTSHPDRLGRGQPLRAGDEPRHRASTSSSGPSGHRRSARLLQKTLTVVVTGMAALMVLRELDVDITPVLTGAGIVGLAVGFGAQTLVRDIISGFFLILEDQVRVGDVAVVNGQGGLVEEVNLRTIVLRDETGAVHVFPNGEVKTLANMSKDFSFYVITISVAFDGDPDRVVAAMRDAAASS